MLKFTFVDIFENSQAKITLKIIKILFFPVRAFMFPDISFLCFMFYFNQHWNIILFTPGYNQSQISKSFLDYHTIVNPGTSLPFGTRQKQFNLHT